MQIFARIEGDIVVEIVHLPDGISIADAFHPSLVFVACDGTVTVGMRYADGAFSVVVPPPPTKVELAAYANAHQWALATGGYTATIGGEPVVFPTDAVSMGLITGKAARLAQPNPPASFEWQTPTGFITIAAADFLTTATAIADFVQATFSALASVLADIGSGAITTFAEVDAAAWPANG